MSEQEAINRAYDRDKRIDQRLKEEHQRGEHKSYVSDCSSCWFNHVGEKS